MENNNVNQQINDAITQTNVKVIGEAPAFAMGTIYQSMVHSTAVLYQSAVNVQNQQNILWQAAATQGVMQIYSLDTGTDGVAVAHILKSDV